MLKRKELKFAVVSCSREGPFLKAHFFLFIAIFSLACHYWINLIVEVSSATSLFLRVMPRVISYWLRNPSSTFLTAFA